MVVSVHYPVVDWRRLPPAFALSVGGLLGLLLTLFVLGERYQSNREVMMQEFGSALVQSTAANMVDAAIGNDLVSLQAILQDLSSRPPVLMAAVFDMDHSLLVQAGAEPRDQAVRLFEAAITIRDADFGTLQVLVADEAPGSVALERTFIGLALLLVAMAFMAMYDCYGDVWYLRQRRFGDVDLVSPLPSDDTEDVTDESAPPSRAALQISLLNGERLRSQLSETVFSRQMEAAERLLGLALPLYGGTWHRLSEPHLGFEVVFVAEGDESDLLLNTVCCAVLVRDLWRERRLRLTTAILLHADQAVQPLTQAQAGVFIPSACVDDPMFEKIEFGDPVGDFMPIERLLEPYQTPVTQQLMQLITQFEPSQ